MSYLPKNEENEQAPQGQTSNNPAGEAPEAPPTQSGGSVGDDGGGSGAAKGSATGSSTQFGSSASKLGDYLSANAPQIGQQADKVVGKFNDQYSQLNQGITNAANQFNQQVQGGYAAGDQNTVNSAVANPTQFTATPENIAKFQAQYNDQYTGPQNFESTQPYTQIQGNVQNAVNQGNLLQNQAGLASYLQGNSKNPTKASSTLDSLLLSGNPDAQQKIQAAGKQFNNLTGQLDTAKTGANQSVQDAQKAAQDAAAYAHGQVDPYAQNFGNTLNQNYQNAQNQVNAYNNQVSNTQQALGGVTPQINTLSDILANLGQAPISVNTSGLQKYTTPVNVGNVASSQDYATQNALQQLLGQSYTNPVLDPSQAAQAGTYKAPDMNTANVQSLLQPALTGLVNEQLAANQKGNGWGGAGMPGGSEYNKGMYSLLQYLSQNQPDLVKNVNQNYNGVALPQGYQLADTSGLQDLGSNLGGKYNPIFYNQ